MFRNFYTTRMSAKGRTLQVRFMKMRRKNGRFAWAAGMILALVISISFVCALIALAAVDGKSEKSISNLEISAQQLGEYKKRIVGSMMADIAYADGDRAVFYYGDGVYVYNTAKNEIERSFDLNKLNCAQFRQGDYSSEISVSSDGHTALIVNRGMADSIKNFKNYRLDLENGIAYETHDTELENPAGGFSDSYDIMPYDEGWFSDRSLRSGGSLYYLTLKDGGTWEYIRLVCLNETTGEKNEYFVFNDGKKP